MRRKKRRRRRERQPTIWEISDELWERIAPVLPREEFRPSGGRPWVPPRQILNGVLYVLRTGCQWKAVPREYGAGSTVHRRFQRWVEQGCWKAIWRRVLREYEREVGLAWGWQSADASLHKAPLGGGKNRAHSHRSRQGRHQAPSLDRRRWDSPGGCPHCGEHA
jgi:transposase